jgi:hypothetical protein
MATVNTNWVSPASATLDKATGETIDETMTDAWSSDLYHLGGTAGYIGAHAFNSGAQSLPNNSETAIGLDGERFDSDPNGAIHDTATNNSRLTCRTAGVYHLSGGLAFTGNATGERYVSLRLNGTTSIARVRLDGQSTTELDLQVSTSYLLAASDYVELTAFQTSGGALNTVAISNSSPFLAMVKA